ncbi:MAG: ribosomal L7Ae/L30e/S12e/Gadd45 family protein [Gemmatimonadaceae bacterium]|nr:ribosomal L7Ae/L30e/S12e/Gadd45 family protein [Gemmatimonadaceae bacterium]
MATRVVERAERAPIALDPAVERQVLGLLGLGARARNVVVGVDRVRDAVRRNKVILAIVAPDASRHSREKVLPLLQARRVRTVEGSTADALGGAVGKASTAVVGITDASLAAGVRRLVDPTARAGRTPGPRRTR